MCTQINMTPKFISCPLYQNCLQSRVPSLIHLFNHSFIHTFIHSLTPALSWPPARLGVGEKMKRTQQGLQEQDQCPNPGIPGLFGEFPRARLCGAGFCALSQSNESCWTANDDGGPAAKGTACSKPARHRGLFPPHSSLCHLLSSTRQFNLELSQGEGGRNVRGHLNSP